MKRRLFNAVALVSLLLALISVGLWVRSYWHVDFVWVGLPRGAELAASSSVGALEVSVGARNHRLPFAEAAGRRSVAMSAFMPDDVTTPWNHLLAFNARSGGRTFLDITVPYWFLCVCSAIAPIWALRRALQRPASACAACGYDLRGTPDNKTCPECGAASGWREAKA
jgi:hypothetical protein